MVVATVVCVAASLAKVSAVRAGIDRSAQAAAVSFIQLSMLEFGGPDGTAEDASVAGHFPELRLGVTTMTRRRQSSAETQR